MLLKLTPVVNVINILQTAVALIFFRQKKITNPYCNNRKAVQRYTKAAHKILLQLIPVVNVTNIL